MPSFPGALLVWNVSRINSHSFKRMLPSHARFSSSDNFGIFKLRKTFLRISCIRKIAVTWIFARVFAYLPSFHSQILDLIYWTVLIFYFDLFWMAWHWKSAIGKFNIMRVNVILFQGNQRDIRVGLSGRNNGDSGLFTKKFELFPDYQGD